MDRRHALKRLQAWAAGAVLLAKSAGSASLDDGPLPLQYLANVRRTLEKIWSTEIDNLLEASHHIARTIKSGGTCYSTWDVGHSRNEDMFEGRHGDPDLFTYGFPENDVKAGNLYLAGIVDELKGDPRKKGVFVIGGTAPWCAETEDADRLLSEAHKKRQIRKYSDLWIDTYVPTHGSFIWLPGAKYPMGAVSTVLGMTTFWMMIADAVRILTAESVTVNVKGDEPQLDEKAEYISLTSPLADLDFVIMGIYKPEDTVDLAYLDRFRKAGSTVASIGPVTRNGIFTEGKTVPSMTETPDCGAGIKSI